MSDIELVHRRLSSLIDRETQADARAFVLVHPGPPVSWERPGEVRDKTTGRVLGRFTPAKTRKAEEALMWEFIRAIGRRPRPLFLDTVALVTLFFVPSKQRKDTDNLAKLVMDAGTKAKVWDDDSQVIRATQCLEIDRTNPRTVIAIAAVLGTKTKAPLLMSEVNP